MGLKTCQKCGHVEGTHAQWCEHGKRTVIMPDERDALRQLFAVLRRGGDASAIMRSDSMRSVQAKVQR